MKPEELKSSINGAFSKALTEWNSSTGDLPEPAEEARLRSFFLSGFTAGYTMAHRGWVEAMEPLGFKAKEIIDKHST